MNGREGDGVRAVSFRDPAGRLFRIDDRLVRFVHESAAPAFEAFLKSASARDLHHRNALVGSHPVDDTARVAAFRATTKELGAGLFVEHDRLPFVSYPHEWPAVMLYEAGRLTLEVAERVLEDGYGLKDATPYNVVYCGPQPVFVDVLSFEPREPRDPTWLPYAQFVRTFVLPLLASRTFGLAPGRVFATSEHGLAPEDIYRLCGVVRRLTPPFLTLATIPTWLDRRQTAGSMTVYRPRRTRDAGEAIFVLRRLFRSLSRTLERVKPRTERSHWSEYAPEGSYSKAGIAAKRAFMATALADAAPGAVLDVGCNTGEFSVLAARAGARVVGIDADEAAVTMLWRQAAAERLDVVPLVVDLANPTAATGWRNADRSSFLERATGAFDMVLCLAVLHHLLVDARIPLADVVDLVADLTRRDAIIEFVGREDPMFQRIARGRDALFEDVTVEAFERAVSRRFSIVRAERLPDSHRYIYFLQRSSSFSTRSSQ